MQARYDAQVLQCTDLTGKLGALQKDLCQTIKLLSNTEEELKKCKYALKERDFIISEQKKAENALAHQAFVLRTDLEKSLKDNTSLFSKIAREDKLNADNRSVVTNFQTELKQQLSSLCNIVTSSVSEQNEHLQNVEILCNSLMTSHKKAVQDIKSKVNSSRALFISHVEALQNVVRLHGANSDSALEEISTKGSSNLHSLEEFLASESVEEKSIFDDLYGCLSSHQVEMAHFARELRQVWMHYINLYHSLGRVGDEACGECCFAAVESTCIICSLKVLLLNTTEI